MLTRDVYSRLYRLTADVTPTADDCGLLCGSACCRPNAENSLGIYLFPGEETMLDEGMDWIERELHDPNQYSFPTSWRGPVHFVKCKTTCPRSMRPLACRFFPLTPHLLRDDTLLLIYETMSLPYTCPLISQQIPLQEVFINTVAHCWQVLLDDPRIRDLVREDSLEREVSEVSAPRILWMSK